MDVDMPLAGPLADDLFEMFDTLEPFDELAVKLSQCPIDSDSDDSNFVQSDDDNDADDTLDESVPPVVRPNDGSPPTPEWLRADFYSTFKAQPGNNLETLGWAEAVYGRCDPSKADARARDLFWQNPSLVAEGHEEQRLYVEAWEAAKRRHPVSMAGSMHPLPRDYDPVTDLPLALLPSQNLLHWAPRTSELGSEPRFADAAAIAKHPTLRRANHMPWIQGMVNESKSARSWSDDAWKQTWDSSRLATKERRNPSLSSTRTWFPDGENSPDPDLNAATQRYRAWSWQFNPECVVLACGSALVNWSRGVAEGVGLPFETHRYIFPRPSHTSRLLAPFFSFQTSFTGPTHNIVIHHTGHFADGCFCGRCRGYEQMLTRMCVVDWVGQRAGALSDIQIALGDDTFNANAASRQLEGPALDMHVAMKIYKAAGGDDIRPWSDMSHSERTGETDKLLLLRGQAALTAEETHAALKVQREKKKYQYLVDVDEQLRQSADQAEDEWVRRELERLGIDREVVGHPDGKFCANCLATTTYNGAWHRGPAKERLCTACGCYVKKHDKMRPAHLWLREAIEEKWCRNCQSTESGYNKWYNGADGQPLCSGCRQYELAHDGESRPEALYSSGIRRSKGDPTGCANCKMTTTSGKWYVGPDGERLCNPCGQYQKNNKKPRPEKLYSKPKKPRAPKKKKV